LIEQERKRTPLNLLTAITPGDRKRKKRRKRDLNGSPSCFILRQEWDEEKKTRADIEGGHVTSTRN